MKKTCVLVLGGEIRDTALFRRRLQETDEVLVADSGARHLKRLGMIPESIYGDMDSLTSEEIREFENGGTQFVVCPAEKSDTDSSIVLKEALSRGYRDIRIWGGLGGRPDHAYANIMLLQFVLLSDFREIFSPQEDDQPSVVIEDGGVRIFLPKRGQWIEGKRGEYLSFFSISPEVTGFSQKGLKYQPPGNRFNSGFPLGVSNEFLEDRVWVSWEKGILLCMQIDGAVFDRAADLPVTG